MIAVLMKTHFLDTALIEQVRSLQAAVRAHPKLEVILSVDAQAVSAEARAAAQRDLPDLRIHAFDSQSYSAYGLKIHPGVREKRVSVNWYHSDYSLIDFYLHQFAPYEAFWQIEYDVSLRKGSWDFLARDFDFDFLAASLKIKDPSFRALVESPCVVMPDWHWWNSLRGYFSTVGCFFPCIRLSARALDYLLAAYRRGIVGYCEVSVPSIMASNLTFRIGGLSEIAADEVELMHPHWNKIRRDEPNSAFQLNLPRLNVDA